MKKTFRFFLAAVCITALFAACKKNTAATGLPEAITQAERAKIAALGFTSSNAYKCDGGYIVEGDIFLRPEDLDRVPDRINLVRVGNEEQYRTTNLVCPATRTLKVRYTGSFGSLSIALNAAIARYNALPATCQLRFVRVGPGTAADITLTEVTNVPYVASSGFPSGCNPFNAIYYNTAYTGWNANTLATIIAHELGHCIGFRHTDWMNRAFSCGGSPVNEGTVPVNAIQIPGTPATPDPNSWMLACIGNGMNRPFNANDITALDYLY